MQAEAKFVNPDTFEVRIEFTMSLAQWKTLRDNLSDKYFGPVELFKDKIRRIVNAAEDKIILEKK